MTSKQLRNSTGFQCDDFIIVYKTTDGSEVAIKSVQIDFDAKKVIVKGE